MYRPPDEIVPPLGCTDHVIVGLPTVWPNWSRAVALNCCVRFCFTVALDEASHPGLRASLRADVQVITDRKARVLKVARGPYADGLGARQVFVIRGDRAIRTPVTLGVSSFEEAEVASGLSEGDEIIISDMRDYEHLEQVWIR